MFKATYPDTLRLLDKELRHLGAKRIVIQLALGENDIRLDGMPKATARPAHPGVILTFESKHGPLSYPCGTFMSWEANLRAIALALEHLRTIDRYGVTSSGEQYRGWVRLPGPDVTASRSLLETLSGVSIRTTEDLTKAYRLAAQVSHPDKGGSAEQFTAVTRARDIVVSYLGQGGA